MSAFVTLCMQQALSNSYHKKYNTALARSQIADDQYTGAQASKSNCYAYALGLVGRLDPGALSSDTARAGSSMHAIATIMGDTYKRYQMTCGSLDTLITRDGLRRVPCDAPASTHPDTRRVELWIAPGIDYHFLRRLPHPGVLGNTHTHKVGNIPPSLVDASGVILNQPEHTPDLDYSKTGYGVNYTTRCGCYEFGPTNVGQPAS